MTEAAERDAIAPKLLVIDDDETFAQLMARRMRRAGYVTQVAHNAEQAIAVWREQGAGRAVRVSRSRGRAGADSAAARRQASASPSSAEGRVSEISRSPAISSLAADDSPAKRSTTSRRSVMRVRAR